MVLILVALILGVVMTINKPEQKQEIRALKPSATETEKARIEQEFAEKGIRPVPDADKAKVEVSFSKATTVPQQLSDSQKREIEQAYINSHVQIINY